MRVISFFNNQIVYLGVWLDVWLREILYMSDFAYIWNYADSHFLKI